MQITRGGEYGLRGVLHLAQHGAGHVGMVSTIADAEDIPPRFLAKIFQMLTRAGLMKSKRGAKGGFSLARPVSQITVRDVLEAIDGPMRLPRGAAGPIQGILEEAQAQMVRILAQATFEDLVSPKQSNSVGRTPLTLGPAVRRDAARSLHPLTPTTVATS